MIIGLSPTMSFQQSCQRATSVINAVNKLKKLLQSNMEDINDITSITTYIPIFLINKNLSDQRCEQVPKAAPEQHRSDKVGGREKARGDDAENLVLMTLSEISTIVALIEITLSACISKSFLWFQ